MNIIKHRKWFFIFSGVLTLISIVSIAVFGLKPSIDFTGGSRLTISSEKELDDSTLNQIYKRNNAQIYGINKSGKTIVIRSDVLDQKSKNAISQEINKEFEKVQEQSFETVGPTIGQETKINAVKAVLIASFVILLYIAFVFRQVSRPVSSWKFGVAAIVALIHDVIITIGAFAILGRLEGVEVDALFITALLTVMGFSVHDTIVVFDRIREHLKRNPAVPFEKLVNDSILETLNRSLNTSLTVVTVLVSMLLFSGGSIRWFLVALLVGIIIGTYSSIFNAAPLLVAWFNFDVKRKKKTT